MAAKLRTRNHKVVFARSAGGDAGIFFFLSGKIVFDNLKESKQEKACERCAPVTTAKFTFATLLLQAVATSIDALVIGFTLATTSTLIVPAILIISSITFILVALALFLGKKLGEVFGKYAEWVGAVILLALAIKSLVEAIV